MRLRVHSVRLAAAALVVGLALTGCSASAPQNGGGGDEQTLRLALSAAPSDLSIGNGITGDPTIYYAIYDRIVHRHGDKLEPGIARSWKYNADRTQLTLKIRGGLKFSNGNALDAAAVAANLEAERKTPASTQLMSAVSGVKAPDASTVVVTLSRPDASLLPNFAEALGGVGDPKLLGKDSSKLAPIGSGPYILNTKKSKTGSLYRLDRNKDYWDVKSFDFKHVEIQAIPDPTAVQNALLAGQIDYGTVGADVVSQFKDNVKFHTGDMPGGFAILALIDRTGKIVPALGDARVRQAINRAINRNKIVDKLLFGQGTPTNQMFNPQYGGFDKELLKKSEYNLDAAKKLMADAGYADGFKLTLPSNYLSAYYEPTLTQSLGDIGIKVTWQPVPFNDLYPKVFGGSYGAFFIYGGGYAFPAQDATASLHGIFNPFGYTTPKLDALAAAANAADESEQDAAFKKVNAYLVDQAWFAPLNVGKSTFVTTAKVKFDPTVGYGFLSAFSVSN
ncbi:ABC transporter substrate-binding protein [Streptomyces sp. GTA36]